MAVFEPFDQPTKLTAGAKRSSILPPAHYLQNKLQETFKTHAFLSVLWYNVYIRQTEEVRRWWQKLMREKVGAANLVE